MVLRHGIFSGEVHTTSFAGNFEKLVEDGRVFRELKRPPVPPDDLVKKYFHEVGAAGKLAERSKVLLQQAIKEQAKISPVLETEGAKVKHLWEEFESFLYGPTKQPELAEAVAKPAKAAKRVEGFELRIHKCDLGESDRLAQKEADEALHGKPKKKRASFSKLLRRKNTEEQKALKEAKAKQKMEDAQGKWTIHGLWPLWDSDCPGKDFKMKKMSNLRSELDSKWPACAESKEETVDERKNANEEFWKTQYDKHGRCSELKQKKYFKKGLELFDKYVQECPKDRDADECRICLDRKLKNKIDCPTSTGEPSFPKEEIVEEKKGPEEMNASEKKDQMKDEALAMADAPPTPPWAHDPLASPTVKTKESMAERANLAAFRADGAAVLATGMAEESMITVARAEELMKSRHGGLRQAWRTGIDTVSPQVIGSMEEVEPPKIISPHEGFAHEETTGPHCTEVCNEVQAEQEVADKKKMCTIM